MPSRVADAVIAIAAVFRGVAVAGVFGPAGPAGAEATLASSLIAAALPRRSVGRLGSFAGGPLASDGAAGGGVCGAGAGVAEAETVVPACVTVVGAEALAAVGAEPTGSADGLVLGRCNTGGPSGSSDSPVAPPDEVVGVEAAGAGDSSPRRCNTGGPSRSSAWAFRFSAAFAEAFFCADAAAIDSADCHFPWPRQIFSPCCALVTVNSPCETPVLNPS